MKHIIDSFTTHVAATENTPERDIQVFITDIVLDYRDRAVLKHLVNSDVNIHKLIDFADAHRLAEKLSAENKLVTSQKDVNIRYKKWSLSKKTDSEGSSKPCEEPSVGPEEIYNEKVIKNIITNVVEWCKTRKFQSFISFNMMDVCITKAIYGDAKDLDEQQLAVIRFAKERFTERYCMVSPFNNKGYNLGSELMTTMYPNGVKYRKEQYVSKNTKPTYFVIKGNTITDTRTGKTAIIPESTFGKKNPIRTEIDNTLFYSKQA